jgi:hypothetical protein
VKGSFFENRGVRPAAILARIDLNIDTIPAVLAIGIRFRVYYENHLNSGGSY